MGKAAVAIELTVAERAELEGLAGRRRTAQGLARRARIVLAAADGMANKTIAQALGADENTVGKWRCRFAEQRLDGLYDEPRPGAPRRIGDDAIAEMIRLTLETTPADATHWSLRAMAAAVGHAPSTIHRIWRAFGLQPHAARPSSCRPTPCSSRRSAISSGSTSTRASGRSCCVSTKSRRSRRSAAPSPCCRCDRDRPSGGATTIPATARSPCSPPWMPPPAGSSLAASHATAPASSAPS